MKRCPRFWWLPGQIHPRGRLIPPLIGRHAFRSSSGHNASEGPKCWHFTHRHLRFSYYGLHERNHHAANTHDRSHAYLRARSRCRGHWGIPAGRSGTLTTSRSNRRPSQLAFEKDVTMPIAQRQEKVDVLNRFRIVWSGAFLASDGQTKGELLPRYERKHPAAENSARLVPRKHRSAE